MNKFLDIGTIYTISHSEWANPIQYVPKKGRMTMVENDYIELMPIGSIIGWRIWMYFCKVNKETRKDHFLLLFMDQMLERLAGHSFFCPLDGHSGYNQIARAHEDQEKTPLQPLLHSNSLWWTFSYIWWKQNLEIFMDGFSIFGESFDECLHYLSLVLMSVRRSN